MRLDARRSGITLLIMTLTDRSWFALALACYGVSLLYSVFLWRRGFRRDNWLNYAVLLVGFGLHTTALVKRGFSLERCPVNNLYEAMTFVAWTISAGYVVIGLMPRLRFLGAFTSPVLFAMGIFALMPGLDVHGPKPEFTNGLVSLHAAMILLAYGAFGIGSVSAVMYLVQERDLKLHKLRAVVSLMPPIHRLDMVTGKLIIAGFLLLTGGLLAGGIYLRQTLGVFYKSDPKIIWSLFVWVAYFCLLILRWKQEMVGRRFAYGALGAFVFVMLTFWGVQMLSPLHK